MEIICVVVLIGPDLVVGTAIGLPPMAMMKAHLPLTIPVNPYGNGGSLWEFCPVGASSFNCATMF